MTSNGSKESPLELEFETVKAEFEQWRDYSKVFDVRSMKLGEEYARHNPLYLPVLNGHLIIENLVRELLAESVRNPSCLAEGYTFTARLNILKSISSWDINSPIWELIAKLNALRNSIAHRPDHKKILIILRKIRAITNKSRLFEPGDSVKEIDWIIAFAFALAAFELDLLLAAT